MRMRSPRIAPPVNAAGGIDGDDADRLPVLAQIRGRGASTSVLLPAPGGPVMPTTRALPVRGVERREQLAQRLRARGSQVEIAGRQRARIAGEHAGDEIVEPARAITLLQQLPRDHQALDLAGAFADGAELDVAVELLDRVVLDEAVAAVDLHGLVRRCARRPRRRTAWPSDDSRVTRWPAVQHPGRRGSSAGARRRCAVAMSTSLCWMAWNSEIGRPNCLRSLE